eukprot:scaffold605484_cov22-Prasinocladus_malaysianus.AAC.1
MDLSVHGTVASNMVGSFSMLMNITAALAANSDRSWGMLTSHFSTAVAGSHGISSLELMLLHLRCFHSSRSQ